MLKWLALTFIVVRVRAKWIIVSDLGAETFKSSPVKCVNVIF